MNLKPIHSSPSRILSALSFLPYALDDLCKQKLAQCLKECSSAAHGLEIYTQNPSQNFGRLACVYELGFGQLLRQPGRLCTLLASKWEMFDINTSGKEDVAHLSRL